MRFWSASIIIGGREFVALPSRVKGYSSFARKLSAKLEKDQYLRDIYEHFIHALHYEIFFPIHRVTIKAPAFVEFSAI
jgi:hypothetical protein